MAWKVEWTVFIDGTNVSSAFRPFLMSIETSDKEGTASDTCRLTLDDSNGRVRLPREGAKVRVLLNGIQVFDGVVDTSRSSGTRGSGRLITVTAGGYDRRGKAKNPQQLHRDDAKLGDFLSAVAANAGFSITVDKAFVAIERDYWVADGESLLAIGERFARELGGTFKLRGDKAVLMKRGANPLAQIVGRVGTGHDQGNVISWDIAPFTARGVFTKARAEWFDRETAKFMSKELEISLPRNLPDAVNSIRLTGKDEAQVDGALDARAREAEREGGEGRVELDITPQAQAEAMFSLTGARAGVDGTYRIVMAGHKADRGGGATTGLELKQPGGGAGKDSRS